MRCLLRGRDVSRVQTLETDIRRVKDIQPDVPLMMLEDLGAEDLAGMIVAEGIQVLDPTIGPEDLVQNLEDQGQNREGHHQGREGHDQEEDRDSEGQDLRLGGRIQDREMKQG